MAEAPLWSTSIICKNEEDSFPKLLDSLKEYIERGGEIVVVDTGSTDKSLDVLKSRGFVFAKDDPAAKLRYEEVGEKFIFFVNDEMVKAIHDKFLVEGDEPFATAGKKIFNFGAARKYAGSLCSEKYVMSVDCDEVFSAMNIPFLNHIIRTGDTDQISFVFRYRNPQGEINSITARDKFYNREVCDWKWVVHEQAMPLPGKTSRMISVTEGTLALDHYQHPAEHRSNYLIQMCIDVMESPDNDRHTHWLGRELHFSGRYRSAIKLLKFHIRNPQFESGWGAEKCMSCLYIGDAYISLASSTSDLTKRKILEQKGLSWYFNGTYYEKSFREPWIRIAQFYQSHNEHTRAIQYAQASLVVADRPQTYMNDNSCYGSKPYDIMYWGYWWAGQHANAKEAFLKAKEISPDNPRYENDEKMMFGAH